MQKGTLDYLFAEESDYLVLDFLDSRMGLLVNGKGALVTVSNIVLKNFDAVRRILGRGWKRVPYTYFTDDEYVESVKRICELALEHYAPEQIIINEHFGVKDYVRRRGGQATAFSPKIQSNVEAYNRLAQLLFGVAQNAIPGAHVIRFPEFVYGDGTNKWGLLPLHYTRDYYRFADNSVRSIVSSNPTVRRELNQMKSDFEHASAKEQIQAVQQAHRFDVAKLHRYMGIATSLLDGTSPLATLLRDAKVRNVALYGDFIVSPSIRAYLENSGFSVKYMVSPWNRGTCAEVFPPDAAAFPEVDALVVCDIVSHSRIREKMTEHFNFIVTVEDFEKSSNWLVFFRDQIFDE